MEEGRNKLFTEDTELTPERKQLLTLMYEHGSLSNDIAEEMNKVDDIEESDDAVVKLEFKESLDRQMKQYNEALEFLKEQLQQTTASLRQ